MRTRGGNPVTKTATEIPNKLFYKIGEVCEITDTQPYVLRFWESEFPQLAPRKNRSGQRVYQRKDIDTVLAIKRLLYEEEYTIAGARRKLDDEGIPERVPKAAGGDSADTEPAPAASRSRGGDHPLDEMMARGPRPQVAVQTPTKAVPTIPPDVAARLARLERVLADLKGTLRETLKGLKGQ